MDEDELNEQYEKHELDKKAYAKYYNSCWIDSETDEGYACVMVDAPLTFNSWYDSPLYKKYLTIVLRKIKLEILKKADL